MDLLDLRAQHVEAGLLQPGVGRLRGILLGLDAAPGQQTLGGIDMTVRRNAFGRQVESFETDLHVAALGPDTVRAVFIRAPWVEEVGPDVEVLGVVESGAAAGRLVAVRQGSLLATSFHPEVSGDHRVHRLFVDLVAGRAD